MSASTSDYPSVSFDPTTSKFSVSCGGLSIETTVTDKGSIAEEWVGLICSKYAGKHTVVGLDTEWKPDPEPSLMRAAILQLCVENMCLILQLFHMDHFPVSLRSFLADSNFTFVGLQVGLDISKLKKEYGLECRNGLDLLHLTKEQWPGRFTSPGLKYLAKELVGLDIKKPKDVSISKWHERNLTRAQIEYASIDAYVSYRIGHKLLKQGIVPSS
ncbi:hypothetical protein L6164_014791 [Bauhinia variegata]|uniref:Uncharacterized protein n=1 Tax=Bauhinia variegata TaxID=167791 RepID=A0ACB9NJW0_BAUVA|nr:hypothetical protein L6164_014791 [Bauhinia variegata]